MSTYYSFFDRLRHSIEQNYFAKYKKFIVDQYESQTTLD